MKIILICILLILGVAAGRADDIRRYTAGLLPADWVQVMPGTDRHTGYNVPSGQVCDLWRKLVIVEKGTAAKPDYFLSFANRRGTSQFGDVVSPKAGISFKAGTIIFYLRGDSPGPIRVALFDPQTAVARQLEALLRSYCGPGVLSK